ncbi:hypothetical protein KQX54_006854 [Cotesia glomerata]|uniref:RING-type domain-containing protein n=1 Tax=Cotesia glomerata TaxID=32391 RepID=A0AAV7J6S8_COTGL|nr:hypothetical protein KQX54_006854 [Cotesia glomerata]
MTVHWSGLVFELTLCSLLLLYEYCKNKKKLKKEKNQQLNHQEEICTVCGKKIKLQSKNHKLDCGHSCHKVCYRYQSKKECNICKIESIKDFEKLDFQVEEIDMEKN